MFIFLLFFVKKLITTLLFAAEIIEKINKGNAIPIPKNTKFNRLFMKLIVEVLIENKTINGAGLHGSIMAPKKKPNMNELSKGFLVIGALTFFGINLVKSKLKINNILTKAKMLNAIGEIIPIALVKDSCNSLVKIKPTSNIDTIIPNVTIIPKIIKFFFDSFPDNLPAK